MTHLAHGPELRDAIAEHLAAHSLHTIELDGARRAAVAIVITGSEPGSDATDPYPHSADSMTVVPGDIAGLDGAMVDVAGGAAFLLCRRAATLNRHGGQWSLPGGRMDPGETPEEAALRELHEELGVALDQSSILGRLDDYATRSGFVITPIVVWAPTELELVPDPGEVAHAYRIGLHELRRADSPRFITIPESDRPVVQVPLGRDLLHAPTGAIVLQFRWVALDGRLNERVHHLEQPVFAWR